MTNDSTLKTTREALARARIAEVFGTPEDEYGASLFVSTHLEHQDPAYWEKYLGTKKPDPRSVLSILQLRDAWTAHTELDTFDFTLPGNVCDDVICVKFNGSGDIVEIVVES